MARDPRGRRGAPGLHRRRPALAFATALFALLAAPSRPAEATVVKAMTLAEKTEASPVVLHALVERVETDWEVPGASLQTFVTLRALETIKGDVAPGEKVTLRQGGGQLGDFIQTAPGLDAWSVGEEVVVFLEPLGPLLVPIGIGIGKYAVERRGEGKWVTHAPDVVTVRIHQDQTMLEHAPPMTPQPLEGFLKEVRSLALGIPTADTAQPRKGAVRKAPPALPQRR